MTGKEALKVLEAYNYWKGVEDAVGNKCTHPNYMETKKHFKKYYEEALDIIEKDLEDLDNYRTEINIFDTEEIIENCTVQVWSNSKTGKVSIGWWRNDK